MLTYQKIKELCKKKGVTVTGTEKELGFSRGSLCKVETSRPSAEKVQKLADYFGVSTDYLINGNTKNDNNVTLTSKDERDIAKKLKILMDDIRNGSNGPLYYEGEEIDEVSINLLENAFEDAMKQLKIINKVKYNPNKNKV